MGDSGLHIVVIELPHSRKIQQQMPLATRVTITDACYPGGDKSLLLEDMENATNKVTTSTFKRSKVVLPGHRFTLTNLRQDRKLNLVQFALKM